MITTRSEHRAFDGVQGFYEHESAVLVGDARHLVDREDGARHVGCVGQNEELGGRATSVEEPSQFGRVEGAVRIHLEDALLDPIRNDGGNRAANRVVVQPRANDPITRP